MNFKKLFSVVLIILLVANLIALAVRLVSSTFFWLALILLGGISYFVVIKKNHKF